MASSQTTAPRHPRTPFVVALVAWVVLGGLSWRVLRAVEDRRIRRTVHAETAAAADRFEALLADRIRMLERMAARWEAMTADHQHVWEADALLMLRHVPGFAVLAVLDEKLDRVHTVPPLPPGDGRSYANRPFIAEAARRARETGRPTISRPLLMPDAFRTDVPTMFRGVAVFVPLFRDDAPDGFLAAGFRYEETLATTFGEAFNETYAYALTAGDASIRHELPDADPAFAVTTALFVNDEPRMLRVWPSAAHVARLRDRSPEAVVVGLGVNFLLVALAWSMYRRARRAAKQVGRSEGLLRSVMAAVDRSIVATDANGTITFMNPTAERWLGWRAEELVGQATPERFHDPAEFEARSRELGSLVPLGFESILARARDGHVETRPWTYVRRDGSRFPVSLSVAAITGADGQNAGFVGVADDRTVERAAQAALVRARDAAEDATRTKSEFLARMSHEIRTPLNGVLGMLDLALAAPLTAAQREQLTTAESSARDMLEIVNDLLDHSKLEAGRLELDPQPLPVRPWLRALLLPLASRAGAKGVELVAEVEDDVPARVRVDGHRLRQVLLNLVGNAVKFTDDGEIVVALSCEASPAGVELVFAVTDTGIGIPPDRLQRVFQPFTQADATITRRFGGTGLGLTIARDLAALLGGSLAVESVVGRGSTFTLRVPVEALEPAVARPFSMEGKALVLARNVALRRQLARLLRGWGLSVVAESGAAAALGRPFAAPPSLVVTEPGLLADDPDALAAIAAVAAPTCLLLLLGSDAPRTVPGWEGRVATLAKPVTAPELADAIEGLRRPDGARGPREVEALPDWRGMRVLLVEDNAVNRRVAHGFLARSGCEVREADNAIDGLRLLESERFDVVLMDVQMPEMDGRTATRLLRERERAAGTVRVPVIALTAQAMPGDRERCLAAGMDDFVAKPFDAATLFAAIGRWRQDPAPAPEVTPPPETPPPFSGDLLLGSLGGDRALAEEIVGILRSELPAMRAAVETAVAAADVVAVERAAHKLAGALLSVGAGRAAAVARQVENAARLEGLVSSEETVRRLAAELAALEASLAEWRS